MRSIKFKENLGCKWFSEWFCKFYMGVNQGQGGGDLMEFCPGDSHIVQDSHIMQDSSALQFFWAKTPTPSSPSTLANLARSSSSSFPREGIITWSGKACFYRSSETWWTKYVYEVLQIDRKTNHTVSNAVLSRLSILHFSFQFGPHGDNLSDHWFSTNSFFLNRSIFLPHICWSHFFEFSWCCISAFLHTLMCQGQCNAGTRKQVLQ